MTSNIMQRGSLLSPGYGNPGAHKGKTVGGIPITWGGTKPLVDTMVHSSVDSRTNQIVIPAAMEVDSTSSDTKKRESTASSSTFMERDSSQIQYHQMGDGRNNISTITVVVVTVAVV